jgi:hypothetical protein
MTDRRSLAATVHDTIDDVTTTVEHIHRSVADAPLDVLAGIAPLQEVIHDVKETQDQVIGAVYGLVRTINGQVRRLTIGDAERHAA